GHAYTHRGIPLTGPVKTMPSGGFIHQDGRQLARDVQGGLVKLTLEQVRAVRSWAREGKEDSSLILAVGDVVPLAMAYLSGANFAFVGTAKSEYYVRDEGGMLSRSSWWDDRLERWTGCVYLPWERWLLSRRRCRAVFPRDELTAETLRRSTVPALALGNPMMDGLESIAPRPDRDRNLLIDHFDRSIDRSTVALLPGSRIPEAYANWQQILLAVAGVMQQFKEPCFLAAIAPGLDRAVLQAALVAHGWQPSLDGVPGFPDPIAAVYHLQQATLVLSQAFSDCLHWSDWAIAMAGTATEQFVGLGKPAFILPGEGPQFTPGFAEAQTRLLGESVILVSPAEVGFQAKELLQASDRLQRIAENGRRRMGEAGAAQRIAQRISQSIVELGQEAV
ncbi:MAG TPA: lipid-A-disaccharide synthase-related protein, partial [Thermosynechococcaceae cyanobacterium]